MEFLKCQRWNFLSCAHNLIITQISYYNYSIDNWLIVSVIFREKNSKHSLNSASWIWWFAAFFVIYMSSQKSKTISRRSNSRVHKILIFWDFTYLLGLHTYSIWQKKRNLNQKMFGIFVISFQLYSYVIFTYCFLLCINETKNKQTNKNTQINLKRFYCHGDGDSLKLQI